MPSKVWISDITYIQTKEGFEYMKTIMVLYDRKTIGWSSSDAMGTDDYNELAKQYIEIYNIKRRHCTCSIRSDLV